MMDSKELVHQIRNKLALSPMYEIFTEQPWFGELDSLPQEALERLFQIVEDDEQMIADMMNEVAAEHPDALIALEHESRHLLHSSMAAIEEDEKSSDMGDIEKQMSQIP